MDELNKLGDVAMDSAAYRDATSRYSWALTIEPSLTETLIRRSRAHAAMCDLEAALKDANAVCLVSSLVPQIN